MIFANQDQDPPKQRTDDHVIDIGGLHGIGDQHRKRFVPADDVDSLAREFFDDVFDSRTTDTDTGSDTVDVVVVAGNGNLRPVTGFAGQRLDLDDGFGHLGNLAFEKPLHQVGVFSGEDDLDPAASLPDLDDHCPHPLVDPMRFTGDLFTAREKGLDLAKVDRGSTAIESGYGPGDHLSPQFLVLDIQRISLGLANLLDHDLLGSLSRDTTEDRSEVIGSNFDPGTMHRRFARGAIDMNLDFGLFTVVLTSG